MTGPRPKDPRYPEDLQTVGDHIRKHRLDCGLLQREVAKEMGVSTATLFNWEAGRTEPEVRNWPGIIRFLGYDPLPKPTTWSGWLKRERVQRGMSQEAFATLLDVDPSTVSSWESSRHRPQRRWRERVEARLARGVGESPRQVWQARALKEVSGRSGSTQADG